MSTTWQQREALIQKLQEAHKQKANLERNQLTRLPGDDLLEQELKNLDTQIDEWSQALANLELQPYFPVEKADVEPIPAVEPPTVKPLRIFLCHSTGDKPVARDLYQRLQLDSMEPWLDEEKLLGGQDWEFEIAKAVRTSDVVVVCLSDSSVNRRGFFQKEIKYALDISDQQPEGAIFIIPIRVTECEVPERLSRWQWIDYFIDKEKGYELLMKALKRRELSK